MNNISLEQIVDKIKNYDNIVLTGHVSPDGDAFGACFAMKYIIEKYDENKKVFVVFNDEIPTYCQKMGYDKILNTVEGIDYSKTVLITLDTANYERIAIKKEEIVKFNEIINIDHHISNTHYGTYNYVEDISSASELVYKFVNLFNVTLDSKIAASIYLGIINDTGNFRHTNVTKDTFLVASKLIETNINISEIYMYLFKKSINKTKIFGRAMVDNTYIEKYHFRYYYIPYSEIEKNGYTGEDMDGVSEVLLTIEGCELSVFLKEDKEGYIKGSVRSKNINVSKMCQELFNGGGHIKASGFRTLDNYHQILHKIEGYLQKNEENM